MTFDAAQVAFADPLELYLEISPTAQNQAWQQSQSFSTAGSRYQAYLNQLCLSAVLPWLQEEYEQKAHPWPSTPALPSFWEVVNGTAIAIDMTRFILLPSETIDLSELRVPQEWIDIPSWAGDYYLAVQVEPDDRWVRVWGYSTHQQLKMKGSYEVSDRTYHLTSDHLIQDINILWVARQLCPDETTRQAITPLTTLPLVQAENLLQRLGNPAITEPRLAVPFELWGALLEHGGTRKRLYEQRMGLPEQWSIQKWLRTGVSDFAQQLSWGRIEFQQGFVGVKGTESADAKAVLSRQLLIAGQQYELRVLPQGNSQEQIWRFELRNSSTGGLIPGGFKLKLLTEDLQAFENNEDVALTAQEQLYIDVSVAPGEGLVWETEPLPENYDIEILRF
ncbi:MAG TPA: hypothetical protein DCE56_13375 [Cyanobacteria bacterium UBA8553]|nr:hypothetical protein [Cyanobacteria bacterium UBA8553]